jgi:helix-turn-helix protein
VRPPVARHEPLLLKLAEVGRLLSLSSKVVRGMAARGELPTRRIGGRWMVPTKELQLWLDSLPAVTATQALTALGRRSLVVGYPNTRVEVE